MSTPDGLEYRRYVAQVFRADEDETSPTEASKKANAPEPDDRLRTFARALFAQNDD